MQQGVERLSGHLGTAEMGAWGLAKAPAAGAAATKYLPTFSRAAAPAAGLLSRIPGMAGLGAKAVSFGGKAAPALDMAGNMLLAGQYGLEGALHTNRLQNDDALSNAIATESSQRGWSGYGQNVADNWDMVRPWWLPDQNGQFTGDQGHWFDPTEVTGELVDSGIRTVGALEEIPRGMGLDAGLAREQARHSYDTQNAMRSGSANRQQLIDEGHRLRQERAGMAAPWYKPWLWGT